MKSMDTDDGRWLCFFLTIFIHIRIIQLNGNNFEYELLDFLNYFYLRKFAPVSAVFFLTWGKLCV